MAVHPAVAVLFILMNLLLATGLLAEQTGDLLTAPQVIEAWKDMRFGMFVCWGPVSLTGKEIGWSRGNPTPIEKYDSLYKSWNPDKFDARQWAKVIKKSGARYVVFLLKHHDGFCLWDTKQTDYSIMNSPLKRDVTKELAAACRVRLRPAVEPSACQCHARIGNDFGGRNGLLLSPAQFDRFMLPHLARLTDLGHQYGLEVQLHCCGGYEPLIPAMIRAGLDGLHAVQPCCRGMDLARLKATYGSQILFSGAIDSPNVLIRGTPETVRRHTGEVLSIMAPGGGYIAGASHDYIPEETPVENIAAMFDAVTEFGTYGV